MVQIRDKEEAVYVGYKLTIPLTAFHRNFRVAIPPHITKRGLRLTKERYGLATRYAFGGGVPPTGFTFVSPLSHFLAIDEHLVSHELDGILASVVAAGDAPKRLW